jgi:two-component system LytT family response regulator
MTPPPAVDDRIDRLLQAITRVSPTPERIAARQGSRITLVDPATICFIRAEDKYAVIYTTDREHVLDRILDQIERSLDPTVFLRIHRSVVVNLTYVRELTAVEGGRFLVRINDQRGTALHASRRGVALLRERLHI